MIVIIDVLTLKFKKKIFIIFFCLLSVCMSADASANEPVSLSVIQDWSGDYPVSGLNYLPEAMLSSPVGYLDDLQDFKPLWRVFKPGEKIPDVDFKANFIIFTRNTSFYNQFRIKKILLTDGVTDITIIQTLSTLPVEDKVWMALAVVPKAGIKAINTGNELIPVKASYSMIEGNQAANNYFLETQTSNRLTSDTLNVTCNIGGQPVQLKNGRSEIRISSDSAVKIRTYVSGDLIFGDLNGDTKEDAVLLLAQDTGGSGTFYYIAAAINHHGIYRGTNAVLLGEKIQLKNIQIRNHLIIAEFNNHETVKPLGSPPDKVSEIFLMLKSGNLEDITPREKEGEQLFEGWVTIGHEVRSFQPCSRNNDSWIDGDSPALKQIISQYHEIIPGGNSYKPLFLIFIGKFVEPPKDGFGTDYETSVYAMRFILLSNTGFCQFVNPWEN